MKSSFVISGLALLLLVTTAQAGERFRDGVVGAGAGALVGGPVGAVVGGAAGYVAGPAVTRSVSRRHRYHRARRHY
jgi:hypothetical protein